ncbi:helix-turn-helix domain-containing protein [Prauserella endophytica]|uniref:Helix-turn-helix domain-containing protein n=1 Tax=Prauserella endophytica TaxID=1592324 RepID=A0ABY2S118_9PSEU|nr:helix-turn-helix domain-containing protein [Prauserella endophytica]TKG68342.1 helix-turn-helix domain-containing protein [Prauserella endophytica]
MENKSEENLCGGVPETKEIRNNRPDFYTVREAAEVLRIGASTLYRIIREGDFPAVRLRSRYVVPAEALEQLLAEAKATGSVVDPSRIAAERRMAREVARMTGGASW